MSAAVTVPDAAASPAAEGDPTRRLLDRLDQPEHWDHIDHGVPFFAEHEEQVDVLDADGKPTGEKITVKVDPERLHRILDNLIAIERETGSIPVITEGHRLTGKGIPEQLQPDILGVMAHSRMGTWGKEEKLAIVGDPHYFKGKFERAKEYPFRSAEVYLPELDPGTPYPDHLTGVALLKRDPRINMGLVTYGRPTFASFSRDSKLYRFALGEERPVEPAAMSGESNFDKMRDKIEGEGYSKDSATKIAAKIGRDKIGAHEMAERAAESRKEHAAAHHDRGSTMAEDLKDGLQDDIPEEFARHFARCFSRAMQHHAHYMAESAKGTEHEPLHKLGAEAMARYALDEAGLRATSATSAAPPEHEKKKEEMPPHEFGRNDAAFAQFQRELADRKRENAELQATLGRLTGMVAGLERSKIDADNRAQLATFERDLAALRNVEGFDLSPADELAFCQDASGTPVSQEAFSKRLDYLRKICKKLPVGHFGREVGPTPFRGHVEGANGRVPQQATPKQVNDAAAKAASEGKPFTQAFKEMHGFDV